ncbi:hypothetical protein F3Y22_tig00008289pilonHSYRG00019 [Hibiscus syriacus]|uniref:Uncharacterized protein n=1 Tax=Hibiscus syriacus TaxID=106335 RepID=A0A6A3CA54_HIBSY|nr:hypothetical protein F3Y22_tig00008289pilonHSYRG00019 [Hibiscus syriacus]
MVRDELEHLLDDGDDMADITPAEAPLTPCHEGDYTQDSDKPLDHSFDAATGRDSHGSRSSSGHSFIGKNLNVQELEMLLEAYFVQSDGIFGMNIHIELFDDDKAGMPEFHWTIGGSTAGAVFLYVIAISWCKHNWLLG